jgi:hypothetical protein
MRLLSQYLFCHINSLVLDNEGLPSFIMPLKGHPLKSLP